jgi:putative tricarboxylic transport membrane protein
METLNMLMKGFEACMTVNNLIVAMVGVLLGTLAGVLPGLGITGTVAVLLPFSYGMEPLTALILICGIYFGSQYGGSTTSILVNIPGEATSVVTCIDGYQMAKNGRAGIALGISAIGSFIAGTIGLIGLTFFAPLLANAALAFGPPEFFAIATMGLILLTNVTGKNPLRSTIMLLIGMMFGTIGLDTTFGTLRYTFGVVNLNRGIDFIIFIMGVFGISELLTTISQPNQQGEILSFKYRDLYPTRKDLKRSALPILRGSLIGFFMGLIPGPSSLIATFVSYGVEKKVSKHPEEFGHGAIEGVASPESANNSSMYAQMIPLMSLGIPFSSAFALLISGFMIHGISPGPLLMTSHPELFWGLIASLYIGNVFLLIINLPLVGIFASLLKINFDILMPVITIVTFTGAYAINNSLFDLWVMVILGVVGFFLKCTDYDVAAMCIGIFLCGTVEQSLVQSMTMYDGSLLTMMLSRPIAGVLCLMMALVILYSIFKPVIKTFMRKGTKGVIL